MDNEYLTNGLFENIAKSTSQEDSEKMMESLKQAFAQYEAGHGPHPLLPGADMSQMFKNCHDLKPPL